MRLEEIVSYCTIDTVYAWFGHRRRKGGLYRSLSLREGCSSVLFEYEITIETTVET